MGISCWRLQERVQVKLFGREWVGVLLFLGMTVGIWVLCQPRIPGETGELLLASAYPYRVAFFWSWMQYFPILYLVSSFFFKGRVDTNDTLLVRPSSNAGYTTAAAAAVVRLSCTWGMVAFLAVLLFNACGSGAPCLPWLYGYYLLTLVLPSAVFMTGLAFFLFAYTRHVAIGILCAFVLVWLTLNLSGTSWQGILNFTGINLPNEFSGITGFTPRGPYLLHRLGWTLAGIGLVFVSAARVRRPENSLSLLRSTRWLAVLFCLGGAGSLFYLHVVQESEYRVRSFYADTYNRHADRVKLTLVSSELDVTPGAGELTGLAKMSLRNDTDSSLVDFVLYLNPGLSVSRLTVDGEAASYRRDGPVLVVDRGVAPRACLEVELHYCGGIDGRVFYLDVPEERVREVQTWNEELCRKGKSYFFLDTSQVVLYPEALWYPTSVAPVTPGLPYSSETNFTRYALRVRGLGGKTVISQGHRREESGGVVAFHPEHPLPGLSLLAGDYERRSLRLDSADLAFGNVQMDPVVFELYMYPGHYQVALAHHEVSERMLKALLCTFIKSRGNPVNRLCWVETPRTLHAYFRGWQKGSNFVQPELLCFPEKMVPGWLDRGALKTNFKLERRYQVDARQVVMNFLNQPSIQIACDKVREWLDRLTLRVPTPLQISNPLYSSSLLSQHARTFFAREYPGLNEFFSPVQNRSSYPLGLVRTFGAKKLNQEAVRFLSTRDFREVFSLPSLNQMVFQDMIDLKRAELYSELFQRGVSAKDWQLFWDEFMSDRYFRVIDLDELREAMQTTLNVDIKEMLHEVYASKTGEPAFWIKDVKCVQLKRGKGSRLTPGRVSFTVYNDSDFDGEIFVSFGDRRIGTHSYGLYSRYVIPAREGRKIDQYVPEMSDASLYLTPSAKNEKLSVFVKEQLVERLEDTVSRMTRISLEEFLGDEIVVDNVDSGFFVPRKSETLLQRYFPKKYRDDKRPSVNPMIDAWQTARSGFGYVISNSVGRPVSNNGSDASWQTELPRAGKYEVLVFVDPSNIFLTKQKRKEQNRDIKSLFFQYYTVEGNGQQNTVSLDLTGREGWISLGTFDFSAGPAKVILHDKGIQGDLIWADAVKWVKVK